MPKGVEHIAKKATCHGTEHGWLVERISEAAGSAIVYALNGAYINTKLRNAPRRKQQNENRTPVAHGAPTAPSLETAQAAASGRAAGPSHADSFPPGL
jgi:hypothetical protein